MLSSTFKKVALVLGLLTLISILMLPTASASTTSPYYGKDYSQPEQVLKYYPEPDINFDTPAFTSNKKRFTSQEEMMSFVRELSNESHVAEMEIIGHTTEGRAIPMLKFRKGENQKEKPNVWLNGQIHSNEPASGETSLVMAEKLAGEFGEDILEKINVNLVPRVNPDGAYYFTRQTAKDLDANRDHFKLETPEIKSIHKAFNKFEPEVSVVGHEYGTNYNSALFQGIGEEGALAYHDILMNSGRNLGIPEQIRDIADDLFTPNMKEKLTKRGFSNGLYYGTTDRNEQGQLKVQELTYGADRGPSNLGLQPAISFITETRGGQELGRENFKRRVASAVTAQTSILKTTAQNPEKIKELVNDARKDTIQKGRYVNDDDKVVIDIKEKRIPNQNFTVRDVATGKAKDLEVEFLSKTDAIPTLERVRPTKYVLLPEQEQVAKKIEANGVTLTKTKKPIKLEAESYTVTDKKVDEAKFEGTYQSHVKTDVTSKEMELPKGSYVFSTAQPTGNKLPVMLEPESPSSYVTWNNITSKIGDELPIYRVMKQEALSGADIKQSVKGFVTEASINDSAARPLQTHLSAVGHYEEKGDSKKVVKHMNQFKTLLDNDKDNDLISEEAHRYLKTSADSLLENWE